MSLPLYMDVHVPYAITTELRLRGVEVITAQDDETIELEDAALLDRATELGCVIFTQDNDFLREATQRQVTGQPFAGVVYGHQMKVTIGQCVEDLELIAKVYEPEEMASRVEYLPLS